MSEPNQPTCLNCGSKINGVYCSTCGQSASVHRITFRDTLNDFFSSTFALEGPLMSTIKLIIVNPGELLRNFIAGRRKEYYKPVAFFVLLTAIYLILRSLIGYDPFQNQPQMKNPDMPERARIFYEAGRFMVTNINNIMFFLVFSIALWSKVFFYKKYNLAEYMTVGFYVSGIYIIVGIIQMLFSVFVFFVNPQYAMIFLFVYLFYVSMSFQQEKSFIAILKYIFLSVFSILTYMILGFGFSLFMVS